MKRYTNHIIIINEFRRKFRDHIFCFYIFVMFSSPLPSGLAHMVSLYYTRALVSVRRLSSFIRRQLLL